MAHKILGIEMGAYSVKVVVAQAGFRVTTLVGYLERPVPDGDEPLEERATRTLAELLRDGGLEHDVPHVALAGDQLSMRVVDFGFSGMKRADLDKAVGAELEAQLPHDLDDLRYDFEVLAAPRAVLGSARPAAVGTRILAAATTRDRVAQLLRVAQANGVEPRSVLAAPALYARVVAHLDVQSAGPVEDAVVVIDHGHARTNVCVVVAGRAVFARTLSRGGRHLTQAIARAWNVPFEEAERAKHEGGFVASPVEPMPSFAGEHPAWAAVSDVLTKELGPLVRDLRQTFAACRAQSEVTPGRALLCGGGGRLRGLASYLAAELGIPVHAVSAGDAPRLVGAAAAARGTLADSALLAGAVVLEAASGRPAFDLRKGDLSYRADFSFLSAKAGPLAAGAFVCLAFWAISAWAELGKLRREEGLLDQRLAGATTELFGEPVSASGVKERIAPKEEQSPLPKSTAFDQLVEISRKLPPRDKVKLDVRELEIKPQKTFVKATADSAASIDEIEKRLKDVTCFDEVQRGKVQGEEGGKEFSLTITTKCM